MTTRRFLSLSLLTLLLLLPAVPGLRAATVYDITAGVPVRFWGSAFGRATSGPIGQVEVSGGDFLAAGGGTASLGLSGATSSTTNVWFDTAPGTVQMEPGRVYTVTVSGAFAGGTTTDVALNAAPPLGYSLEIDYMNRHRATFNGSSNHTFMVRLLGNGEQSFRGAGAATDLMVGRIYWQVGLGGLRNGKGAGSIALVDAGSTTDWSALYTPSALEYEPPSDEIVVLRTAGYVLRQIIANQSIVDIVPVSATKYELNFYHPGQVASGANLELRTFNGQPYLSYQVEQGATATTLKVTSVTRNTTAANSWTSAVVRTTVTSLARTGSDLTNFVWTRQGWNTAGAAQVSEQVINAGGTLADRTDTLVVRAPNSSANEVYHARTYHLHTWGEEMTGDSTGSTNVLASGFSYYDNTVQIGRHGYLASATSPGGGWEAYDYWDATSLVGTKRIGTLRYRYRPFKDFPATVTTNVTQGEATTYDYSDDPFGVSTRPTLVQTEINGLLTAKSTTAYAEQPGPVAGTTVVTATRQDFHKSGGQAGSYLTTVTKYFREDTGDIFLRRQIHSVTQPDAVKVSFAYQRGTLTGDSFAPDDNGLASRIATITGVAGTGYASYAGYDIDDLTLIEGKSTLETVIRDSRAFVVRTESYAWVSSSWQLVGWVNNTYDTFGQLTVSTSSIGATSTAHYEGAQLQYAVDQTGVRIDYEYDTAGRTSKVKKRNADNSGFTTTTTYAYDAAGRVTAETVSGTGTTEEVANHRAYDDAGRITGETPAGMEPAAGQPHAIMHAYNPALRQHTVTNPDGGYSTTTSFPDGRPEKVTGTVGVDTFYSYDIEQDGRARVRVDYGTATSERYEQAWSDWLGRQLRSERPGFSHSLPAPQGPTVTEHFYDDPVVGPGRRYKSTTTGSAPVFYEYDPLGQLIRSGLDLDTIPNGLTNDSNDRITAQDQYVEPYEGALWLTTVSRLYFSATPTTASITRQRLTGHPANRFSESRQWDIENISAATPTSTTTVDVSPTTKTVITTTTAAGLPTSQLSTAVNGLAVSLRTADDLTFTSSYDGLERLKREKNPRHVTSTGDLGYLTYTYKSGTALVESITDPAGHVVALNRYDKLGRIDWTRNADSKSVRTAYNVRGQVVHQWGDATYPIEYGYNEVFGEKISLGTFRSAPAGDAETWPAVGAADLTHWEYDVATGLPWKKRDAAGREVEFDYNVRGQMQSRKWARTLTAAGHTGERLTTTYDYYTGTGELWKVSYNDEVEPIPTPDVTYTYDRLGRVTQVDENAAEYGLGARTFHYDPARPWRLLDEVLPAGFGGRVLTRLYEEATSANTGTLGSQIQGTQKGRQAGFELGLTGDTDRDLRHEWAFSNRARFAAVRAGGGADFVYAYKENSGLLDGYARGDFTVSRDYEENRDLVTRLETRYGLGTNATVARLDYTHDTLGRRETAKQSGAAYAAYTAGQTYGAVYHRYAYNARSELESDRTYGGNDPTLTANELPGRRLEYRYDAIGNRRSAGATGSGDGALNASGAGDDDYAVNALNQYTGRENNTVTVTGLAASNASVAVAGTLATPRVDNAWANAVSPANLTGPATGQVTAYAAVPGASAPIRTVTGLWLAPSRQQTFAYDLDGNLTGDGLWTYTYNAENRLVRMTSTLPEGFGAALGRVRQRIDFKYDYAGRRTEKRVKDIDAMTEVSARRFIYDGWNLVAELDGTGTEIQRSYTWGLDLSGDLAKAGGVGALLQLTNYSAGAPGASYYPAYDGNGNVIALVNAATGGLAAVYEYDPFGNPIRTETLDAAVADNPFRFSTKYADAETGLVYYGHRYYSPTLGRFINKDPIEEAGGFNLYGFCGNNGVNSWDYLGMDWDDAEDRYQAHLQALAQYEEIKRQVDLVYGHPANWGIEGYGSSLGIDVGLAMRLSDAYAAEVASIAGGLIAYSINLADQYAAEVYAASHPPSASSSTPTPSQASENLQNAGYKVTQGTVDGKKVTFTVTDPSGNDVVNIYVNDVTGNWESAGQASSSNRTATTNGNDTLLGQANFWLGRAGGQGFDNTLNTATDASNAALGGAAGFQNRIFLGATSTAGFDPAAVQVGQQVGSATLAVGGTLVAGAGVARWGSYLFTPTTGAGFGFWSGTAGRATLAAAGIGQIASTPFGQWATSIEARFGQSMFTNLLWRVGSAPYAANAALSGQPSFYAGTGAGYTWVNIEQPVLTFLTTNPTVLSTGTAAAATGAK